MRDVVSVLERPVTGHNVPFSPAHVLRAVITRCAHFLRAACVAALVWEIALASTIPAVVMARQVYRTLDQAQVYTELVAGPPAWRDLAKTCDYAFPLALIVGYFASLIGLGALAAWIEHRCGRGAVRSFRSLLIYSSIPAVLWLSGSVLDAPRSLSSFYLSSALLGLVCWNSLGAARLRMSSAGQQFQQTVGASLLIPVLAGFSGLAVSLSLWHIRADLAVLLDLKLLMSLAALVAWVATFVNWSLLSNEPERHAIRWRRLLLAVQIPLPLLFLVLIPGYRDSTGNLEIESAVQPSLYWAVGTLAAVTGWDIVRRGGHRSPAHAASILSAVSPWSVVAILLILKASRAFGSVPGDDYHFGEYLLPWWLTHEFGFIPYWDYAPARGLVNYVRGVLATLFMDGTAASHSAVVPIVRVVYLVPALFLLKRSVGLIAASLMLLLMPIGVNGLSSIDLVTTVALCLASDTWMRSPAARWLAFWALGCVALVLYAPGQGGLWTIATAPLAAAALYRTATNPAERQWRSPIIALGGLAMAACLTPLGKMIAGAVRYGAEQGSINSVAYGIPWAASWNGSANRWMLFEIARTSFLLVAMVAGAYVLRGLLRARTPRGRRLLVIALPITALMVLFVPRAAGRIDPGNMSRLGIASIWATAMLLPILLRTAWPRRRLTLALLIASAASGLLAPAWGGGDFYSAVVTNSAPPKAPLRRVDGRQLGLPNLGTAQIGAERLKRLRALRASLERLLRDGETYLDLTNRNAQYFYLGYPLPIEAGAYYNLPTESQQLRAVRRLRAAPCPVALIGPEILAYDDCLASLRVHLIYRDLVQRWKPVELDGSLFLVEPSRWAEMGPETRGDNQDTQLALLDRVFRHADLRQLPRAWGRSFDSLVPGGLRSVARLSQSSDSAAAGRQVAFDLSPLNLCGRDAGILAFELEGLDSGTARQIEVSWTSEGAPTSDAARLLFAAHNGRFVVPLDAAPRWLLSGRLQTLRIGFADPQMPGPLSIRGVELFQRRAVDELEQ